MMNSEKAGKTGASNLSADNSMAKAWVSSFNYSLAVKINSRIFLFVAQAIF